MASERQKLFVANLTKQHHLFLFRLPENPKLHEQRIPLGEQAYIANTELTTDQIGHVVKQHERYGLIDVNELKNKRGFTGMCYSIGKPINLNIFLENYERNDDALDDRSMERMQRSAEAISSRLNEVGEAPLTHAEIETVEETDGVPSIAAGVEVVPEGVRPRRDGKEGRKARRLQAA